MAEML